MPCILTINDVWSMQHVIKHPRLTRSTTRQAVFKDSVWKTRSLGAFLTFTPTHLFVIHINLDNISAQLVSQ